MLQIKVSRLIFVTLIGFGVQFSVVASDITIGESNIVIPVFDGFSHIVASSPTDHPLADSFFKDCDQKQCAVFIGHATDTDNQSWEDIAPFVEVRIMGDEFSFDEAQFEAFKLAARNDIDGLRATIAREFEDAEFHKFAFSPDGEPLELIDSPIHVSDEVLERDSFVATSASGGHRYKTADGSRVNHFFRQTGGIVHVRGKLLWISVIEPRADVTWDTSVFEGLAREVLDANRHTAGADF